MLSRWARRWTPNIFHPINRIFIRLGITPNGLTAAGLLMAVLCGICIAFNHLLIAGGCLILSGLLDALDGELARQSNNPSQLGPFIDSVADHYGDFAIYFGLAWRAAQENDHISGFLILAAMFGSVVGSHIRSRAGMVGVDTKSVGSFTRMERTLIVLFGLFSRLIVPALVLLVVGNNISALQRVIYTLKASKNNKNPGL